MQPDLISLRHRSDSMTSINPALVDGSSFRAWLDNIVARNQAENDFFFKRIEKSEGDFWEGVSLKKFYNTVQHFSDVINSLGIQKGDVVAFISKNNFEWDVFHYACLLQGAVVLGVDYHAAYDQQNFIISLSRPACFFVDTVKRLDGITYDRSVTKFVVSLDSNVDAMSNGTRHFNYNQLENINVDRSEPVSIDDADSAVLIFSSGTTGRPKGIMYTHGQLLMALDAMNDHFPEVTDFKHKNMACWMPLSNMFQRMLNLFGVSHGFKIYYCPDPVKFFDLLGSIRPSVLAGVPRLFEKIAQESTKKIHFLPEFIKKIIVRNIIGPAIRRKLGGSIEALLSGSAKTPQYVLDLFENFSLPIYEAYGMSENLIPIASNNKKAHRKGSVGKVLKYNTVSISDEGEIWVTSPGMGAPFGTGSSADQPYHSGDLGLFDEDGFLYVDGRIDSIIKTSTGVRIGAEQLEEPLRKVPGITQCIVIGSGRKLLVAIVVSTQSPEQVAKDIEVINAGLSRRYRICGVLITKTAFSPVNGLTTSNFKLNRRKIDDFYKDDLDKLYLSIDKQTEKESDITAPLTRVVQ